MRGYGLKEKFNINTHVREICQLKTATGSLMGILTECKTRSRKIIWARRKQVPLPCVISSENRLNELLLITNISHGSQTHQCA